MTSVLEQVDELTEEQQRALDRLDLWAIQVVVREGKPMRLITREGIIAAQLMRRKGIGTHEQARRLGVTRDLVNRWHTRKACIDIDLIPEYVMGAPEVKVHFTDQDARKMMNGRERNRPSRARDR